jgi:hypothetical protein
MDIYFTGLVTQAWFAIGIVEMSSFGGWVNRLHLKPS